MSKIEHRTPDELARKIARAIFETGDETHDTVQRIQFMGGTYPDHETALGGLCEVALMQVITRVLEQA